MVNIAFVGVSASKGNLPNFATEIKNEAIMNTKRNLLLVAGLLLAMTSQAQQSNDRIPAKGFAFHAEDGHFHDYELPAIRLAIMMCRLKSFMPESAIATYMKQRVLRRETVLRAC